MRFLATLGVGSCITVFVRSPDGRAFGLHLNGAFVMLSVRERRDAPPDPFSGTPKTGTSGQWGTGLEMYSGEMQELFRGVDPSQLRITLVGGWKKADFSGVVRKWVAEVLPGAAIDGSLLNRFEGFAWGQEDQALLQDQRFGVVALDSRTGKIVTHTKYAHDSVRHKCGPIPQSVLDEAAANALEVKETLQQIDPNSMPWES